MIDVHPHCLRTSVSQTIKVYINHLEILSKQILIQWAWNRTYESTFITSIQVMVVLLVNSRSLLQNMVHGPVASAIPRCLIEIQNF